MDELRDMRSKTNSLEGVKEKYDKGILDAYDYIMQNYDELMEPGYMYDATLTMRRKFENIKYDACVDESLGSNYRWGIVSLKNFFGLDAVIFPDDVYESREFPQVSKSIYLKANAGRFQPHKFNMNMFPNLINISDIFSREPEDYFSEIEMFYNMTNRQLFEKFGVLAHIGNDTNLLAHCVVLDSLLQGKHSEMEDVFCYTPYGYVINIELADGTKIFSNTDDNQYSGGVKKGITIQKDGKEARMDFDTISIGERSDLITNINDLEVENVVYTGDPELIEQLKKAMEEQFKSQQKDKEIASDVSDKLQKEEKTGKDKFEANTHNGRRSNYEDAVLQAYRFIMNHYESIIHHEDAMYDRMALGGAFLGILKDLGLEFNDCFMGHKNFFGLEAVPFPEEVYDREEQNDRSKALFLRARSGRFNCCFPNLINISDILQVENEEGYISEFERFYNMSNRQVFERFGIEAKVDKDINSVTGYIVLDSLLKGKHSEIKTVMHGNGSGNFTFIRLADGTKIYVNPWKIDGLEKGITIQKDGKEARMDFDTISIGERSDLITNINDLEVENVVYTGDPELIEQLQKAMEEQFKSQQREEDKEKTEVPSKSKEESEEIKLEQPGAQKIIEFMNEHNLGPHDLSLALTMVLAKTTDKTKAEQHIINVADKSKKNPENSKSEH